MSDILRSKLPEHCVYLDSMGIEIKKGELLEELGDGWIGYLITMPVSNAIYQAWAVMTSGSIGYGGGGETDAYSTLQEYYMEKYNEELDDYVEEITIQRII